MNKHLFIFLLFLSFYSLLQAQNMLITRKDTTWFKYKFQASGLWDERNINRLSIRISQDLLQQNEYIRSTEFINLRAIDAPGKSLVYDVKTGVNIYLFYRNRIYPELRCWYTTSTYDGIVNKFSQGGGFGGYIIQHKLNLLQFTNGLIYDYVDFRINASVGHLKYYVTFLGELFPENKRITLNYRYSYNIAFIDATDQIHRFMLNLLVPLTKKASFTSAFDYVYAGLIDEGKKHNLYNLTFGITIKN